MQYSVAHTHWKPVKDRADSYGFNMYPRRLNTWLNIWCVDVPEDSKYTSCFLLEFGTYLTLIKD